MNKKMLQYKNSDLSIVRLDSFTIKKIYKCHMSEKYGKITPQLSFLDNFIQPKIEEEKDKTPINNNNIYLEIQNELLYGLDEIKPFEDKIEIIKQNNQIINISCKPTLNSISSKNYLKKYSKIIDENNFDSKYSFIQSESSSESSLINHMNEFSKTIDENNNNNIVSIIQSNTESLNSISPINYCNNYSKLINEDSNNKDSFFLSKSNLSLSKTYEDKKSKNEDSEESNKKIIKELAKKLPVPEKEKNNEQYKIVTIKKKLRRKEISPNTSARKFNEGLNRAYYEKEFMIQNSYYKLKKKKLVNSAKKYYSSTFFLGERVDKTEFKIFRDIDIGIICLI